MTAIILILFPLAAFSQEKKTVTKKELNKVQPLNLGWPFDKHSGFLNYAQELVFNKDKGLEELEIIKEYYKNGFSKISNYQVNPDVYDRYMKDRYRWDADSILSPMGTGFGVFNDFRIAEYWFLKALKAVDAYLKWDTQINSNPEYKEVLENSYKNLLYVTVYNGKFDLAMEYLNTYKAYAPDENFINEWRSRIMGNVVLLHEKYKWVFTGKQSPAYLKNKHNEFLQEMINKNYPQSPELKKELEERVYPEYIIFSSEQKPVEEKKEEPKTK